MAVEYQPVNPTRRVVERALYLAWKACGRPRGMGVFQDHPGATEAEVVQAVMNRSDYPGGKEVLGLGIKEARAIASLVTGKGKGKEYAVHADYVFGRRLKLSLVFDPGAIRVKTDDPTPDYQAWQPTYHTYLELLQAADRSLTKHVENQRESSGLNPS